MACHPLSGRPSPHRARCHPRGSCIIIPGSPASSPPGVRSTTHQKVVYIPVRERSQVKVTLRWMGYYHFRCFNAFLKRALTRNGIPPATTTARKRNSLRLATKTGPERKSLLRSPVRSPPSPWVPSVTAHLVSETQQSKKGNPASGFLRSGAIRSGARGGPSKRPARKQTS